MPRTCLHSCQMIRSLLILFVPLKAWEKIADQSWNVLLVFLSVCPLMVASCAFEGWAMIQFGAEKGGLGRITRLESNQIITFEIIQVGLGLFLLFFGANPVVVPGFPHRNDLQTSFHPDSLRFEPSFLATFPRWDTSNPFLALLGNGSSGDLGCTLPWRRIDYSTQYQRGVWNVSCFIDDTDFHQWIVPLPGTGHCLRKVQYQAFGRSPFPPG